MSKVVLIFPASTRGLRGLVSTTGYPVTTFSDGCSRPGLVGMVSSSRGNLCLSAGCVVGRNRARVTFTTSCRKGVILAGHFGKCGGTLRSDRVPFHPRCVFDCPPSCRNNVRTNHTVTNDGSPVATIMAATSVYTVNVVRNTHLNNCHIPVSLSIVNCSGLGLYRCAIPGLASMSRGMPGGTQLTARLLLGGVRSGRSSDGLNRVVSIRVISERSIVSLCWTSGQPAPYTRTYFRAFSVVLSGPLPAYVFWGM